MPAKTKTIKLDDEVRDVLARSKITEREPVGFTLDLPEQLDPKLYQKVKKIIQAAGGKWMRNLGTHLFTDPSARETLGLAVENGAIVDEKATLQAFFSPPAVVEQLVRLAQLEGGLSVLEPSAGDGAIAEAVRGYGCAVYCVEINPKCRATLSEKGFAVGEEDFLRLAPGDVGFDRVIMNPPFTNGQDCEHVEHALKFLNPGGRLVAVMAASIRYRETQPYRGLREKIEACGGQIIDLPDASFATSGAKVATVVVCMTKEG